MRNQQRHLAAILFTDIVGYTAIMQKNEAEAVRMIRRYGSVLQESATNHSGKILNDYGDGSLCSFPSAMEAVSCAVDVQLQLREEPTVPLRIGLHIGEIFIEDGKIMGDGVNVASRIQSLGQANSILFSGEINSKIRNHPEFRAVSLGKFEFKNVDEPVEVFALANDGLIIPKKESLSGKLKEPGKKFRAIKLLTPAVIIALLLLGVFVYQKLSGNDPVNTKERTIAILPFKNLSVNKDENEPFCAGVALELQKKLELVGGLLPIDPQSVEKFRDTKLSVKEIASELGGINYIVQASAQRDKSKVKVFVSLIDVLANKEIFRDDFPGEIEDIFSLQENIAAQIASELQVKITPAEQSRIARVATRNSAAIDAYNDALTSYVKLVSAIHPLFWDSLASNPQLYAEYRKTLSLCDRVIKIDPSLAEAYVLKGQTYYYSIDGWSAPRTKAEKIHDSANFLANKALGLDPSSADAWILLSKRFEWFKRRDYETADSGLICLKRAFAINANNFDVNRKLGEYYSWRDPEKSIRHCKKAIRLNPLSIWTPDVYRTLGFTYHCFGQFEKAEFYGKKSIDLSGNSMAAIEAKRALTMTYLHWGKADSVLKYAGQYLQGETNFLYELAEAYCNLKDDCVKAARMYEELWNRYGNHTNLNRWAVALINSGKIKEGKEKLTLAFKEYEDKQDTLSYDYAGMCALDGDKEKAISILRQWTWDWGSVYLIQHDRLFDNIRNEKEFKDLLRNALDKNEKLKEKISRLEEKGSL